MLENPRTFGRRKRNQRRPEISPTDRIVRRSERDRAFAVGGSDHRKHQELPAISQDVRIPAILPTGRIAHRPLRRRIDRIFRTTFPVEQIFAGSQTDGLLAQPTVVEPGINHVVRSLVLHDGRSGYDLPLPRTGNDPDDARVMLPMHQIGRSGVSERLFAVRFLPVLRIVGHAHIVEQMERTPLLDDEITLDVFALAGKLPDLPGIRPHLFRRARRAGNKPNKPSPPTAGTRHPNG